MLHKVLVGAAATVMAIGGLAACSSSSNSSADSASPSASISMSASPSATGEPVVALGKEIQTNLNSVGCYAGKWIKEYFFTESAKIEEGERYRVDLRGDEPQVGPNDALVTIIEFSDFQCPYCAKVADPLKAAMDSHEGDVRLIFKHFPLTGHKQAAPAAQAAWAAHQQGKFWEMHDTLFADQKALSDEDLGKLGAKLGLDLTRYEADRHSDAGRKIVDADQTAGNKGGATGTPYFLVNGHPYSGALPAKQWREIISYEMKAAQRLVDAGTARADVYTALMKDAKANRGAASKGPAQRRPGEPDPAKAYRVPIDMRPQHGPDRAPVTLVDVSALPAPSANRSCTKRIRRPRSRRFTHPASTWKFLAATGGADFISGQSRCASITTKNPSSSAPTRFISACFPRRRRN